MERFRNRNVSFCMISFHVCIFYCRLKAIVAVQIWCVACAKYRSKAIVSVAGIQAIRLTEDSIPSHAIIDDQVDLVCNYDMEGDKLYSVKWWELINSFLPWFVTHNQTTWTSYIQIESFIFFHPGTGMAKSSTDTSPPTHRTQLSFPTRASTLM